MKTPLIAVVFPLFLILAANTANIASAESWALKKLGGYYTDSNLVSEGKSVSLIKLTASEDTIKKDSVSNEVSKPYVHLKFQWDTEPVSYTQLGKHYQGWESWHMAQFFLFLQIAIP